MMCTVPAVRGNPENWASPREGLAIRVCHKFYSAAAAASVRLRFFRSETLRGCVPRCRVCRRKPPTPTVMAVRSSRAYHNILLLYKHDVQYDRIYFSEEAYIPREHRERYHRRRRRRLIPRYTTDATIADWRGVHDFDEKTVRGDAEDPYFFYQSFHGWHKLLW